ncbi:ribosome small subunit-dependent GTPase A [Salinisphaera sp.]|uniref:ribosome small subunit-dependent GTPase A n=1 Tax=Salinisphaera sp. TaxID=1914330 RepID=UPI000C4E6646|nr:ribosome small subunit-dependent GTPase A [Salinisphaera sp.]MBS64498.1 ribosome small subunit-dependent GTPase A [Salinisphaera sp.]
MAADLNALRRIGWPFETALGDGDWGELQAVHANARPARVVEQHRSGYIVAEDIQTSYAVESLPDWQRPRLPSEQRPAVGDWLLVSGGDDTHAQAVALLPRRSTIKRSSAGKHYGQQIIAANIDIVFIVSSLDGDFNPRRIERYLLLVRGDARPVVVLTKTDIAEAREPGAVENAKAALATLEVDVCTLNATDPASVERLQRWLAPGITAVLVGSSGVGKSTLTNALTGAETMKTGAVRASDSRGRHTTTHRALIALTAGACLIDTPGMRELKPTGEEDLVEDGFADIEAIAMQCRFRDCRHMGEPGCAVQAAIDSGQLDAARFANYEKLRDEIAEAADQLALRSARAAAGSKKPPGAGKRGKRSR